MQRTKFQVVIPEGFERGLAALYLGGKIGQELIYVGGKVGAGLIANSLESHREATSNGDQFQIEVDKAHQGAMPVPNIAQ